MFREFVSSGNTNINKILNIVATDESYTVPFHEFAKSAILGSRRYYRNNLSHIINVFVKSSVLGASYLTALRILARLASAAAAPSPHGEGFVECGQLLLECRQSFGKADDWIARADELLARGLLESEPPRSGKVPDSDALRISAAGMYYYKYLVRSFAYLDLVFVDTPISDKELAQRLARLAQAPPDNYEARFERVLAFLDFLWTEDYHEILESVQRSGPYVEELIPTIREQVELEVALIRQKKGLDDQGDLA
jgi:hypothetical protein